MLTLNEFAQKHTEPPIDELVDQNESQEQMIQDKLFGLNDYIPFAEPAKKNLKEAVEAHPTNAKRLVIHSDVDTKAGAASGVVVPKHMWEGSKKSGAVGMKDRVEARAKVYGGEHRAPLSLSAIEKTHKETLDAHFKKPKAEQIKAEKEAVERLHAAKHLDSRDTTDKGEKTDTVNHEHDEKGRTFTALSSKGIAGHAVYTSGHGNDIKHHVLNTCPQQTKGCGGGVDAKGVADSLKGTCFAPRAESQYVHASIRRACHEQAKHDPAMTKDWVLAHTHSLRNAADKADRAKSVVNESLEEATTIKGKRLLFRPNVVDETDRSSKHVIAHLNAQRASEGKPSIIANSYGKTDELHDPENGYHVTHSNTGPKVKDGSKITENIGRDKKRIRQTITATHANGEDIKNEQGHKTPTKGSYLVISAKRHSPLDKEFQKHVTHAKYWSGGREHDELSPKEKTEGHEGHFDGEGKPTTPDKAHYGHTTVNGKRYDYQKQHILHPRLVSMPVKKKDKKTGEVTETIHKIPTDSRFKDEEHMPKDRYKSKNGKDVGGILATTPTESTDNMQHHSAFTHHVGADTIEHAKKHAGEYEIDNPHEQEKAKDKEFSAPQAIKFVTKRDKKA